MPTLAIERVFDVTAFGATGDGVTDDTQAIQNALSAAADAFGILDRGIYSGVAVIFPEGNYRVTRRLILRSLTPYPYDGGIIIRGEGRETTTLRADHDEGTLLLDLFYSPSTGKLHVENEDLRFSAGVPNAGTAIEIRGRADEEALFITPAFRNLTIDGWSEGSYFTHGIKGRLLNTAIFDELQVHGQRGATQA